MRDVRSQLDVQLLDRWRATGATLVVEHVEEEPVDDGGAPTTDVSVLLTGTSRSSGDVPAVHSRGTGPHADVALASALRSWSFGPVAPAHPVDVPECPHGVRSVSTAEEVRSLLGRLRAGDDMTVVAHRRTRHLARLDVDGDDLECRSTAWTVTAGRGPGTSGTSFVLTDADAVDVDAVRLEVELASAPLGPVDPDPPGTVLAAPAATLELWVAALDQAYSRGLDGIDGLRLVDRAPRAPAASCFDATGRRPVASHVGTFVEETAREGAANGYLPGLDLPSRVGTVLEPVHDPTPSAPPTDATILLGSRGLAPSGLMSGHAVVIAPTWASVRGGEVVRRWTETPFLTDLRPLLGDLTAWSTDATWRQGLVQAPGAWWTISGSALRPARSDGH